MKKRLLKMMSLCLMFSMLWPANVWATQETAQAASDANKLPPIYAGYGDLDYMAEEILKQIPLKDKTPTEQIRAVYDWVIVNCHRDNWDGVYHFDEKAVFEQVENGFGQACLDAWQKGDIVLRREFCSSVKSDDKMGYYFLSHDSNMMVCTFAGEMMYTHTGNCVHYASLLALLLGHLGYDCRIIDGAFINNNGTMVEHKWNYVLVDGKYYWLDVRMDQVTYQRTGKIDYRYFLEPDTAVWAKKHSWAHDYSDWLATNAATVVKQYKDDAFIAKNTGKTNVK